MWGRNLTNILLENKRLDLEKQDTNTQIGTNSQSRDKIIVDIGSNCEKIERKNLVRD